jgi:hypothetical protein
MPHIKLGTEPVIGENTELIKSILGVYTQIGDHSIFNEVEFGDYSYCSGYNQIDFM